MRDEIIKLRTQLEDHIAHFEKHELEGRSARQEYLELLQENRSQIDDICSSTRDLLAAWETMGGAIKFGVAVGGFLKWLAGFAIVGAAINWFSDHGMK